jgi:heme/copper-type cytochrome/quinol oxidase subunit 1
MASGFMNMLSYWLFFLSSLIMISSLFAESGPAIQGGRFPSFVLYHRQLVVLVCIMVGCQWLFSLHRP